jgi:Divergent InlB B-repeat domain
MNNALVRRLLLSAGMSGCLAAAAAGAETQQATNTSEPAAIGTGGYVLNFQFQWSCDDVAGATTSSPGRIDLVDPNGVTVAEISGTISAGAASIGSPVVGSLSNVACSVSVTGAGGTPADAVLTGTWRLSGVGPGAYTLRFWNYEDWITGRVGTAITTHSADAGGGGPVSPPTIALSAPQAATVFQPMGFTATAAAGSNGNPLASVVVAASADGGATWTTVLSNTQASSPADTEAGSTSFIQAGTATLRATATDAGGLKAQSEETLTIAKANQPGVSLSPAALSLTAGESATFTASGGISGNYAWAGSAAGSGSTQVVAFPTPGTYSLSVLDSGNSNYNASGVATATVSVQAAFFVLSVAAGPGGTVSGGGSYPPNATATAVATPGPGSTFAGWTGDMTGAAPSLQVPMSSNKSVTANFAAMLPQTITFLPPGNVTTRSPPLTLLATASSGLPVLVALISGPASLAGNVLTPAGTTGQLTLTATQPGNAQYLAAPPVTLSFPVGAPPAGVILSDDAAVTMRSDRFTRTTSFRSGPDH